MRAKKKRSIDILGVKHKIRHIDTGDKGGFYDSTNKIIEIDREIDEKQQYLETVLHEALHGVLFHNGSCQDISISQEHCIIDSTITFLMTNFNIEFKK